METLSLNNILCVGIIRGDRIKKTSLKDLKKEERRASYGITDKHARTTLIRWNDNIQAPLVTHFLKIKNILTWEIAIVGRKMRERRLVVYNLI